MGSEDLNMSMISLKEKADEERFFTREKIIKLLDLYRQYKERLGTWEVKSMKKMWELIARDLSNEFGITIAASKCENKFKVLERNYKKVIDNNNRTGRGRKNFEFEEEMDIIFKKKKNIKPLFLLSANTMCIPSASNQVTISIPETEEVTENQSEIPEGIDPQPSCSTKPTLSVTYTPKRKRHSSPVYYRRNDILLQMKNDLQNFYEKRQKREDEKLELAKKRQEDREKRTGLFEEYLDMLRKD